MYGLSDQSNIIPLTRFRALRQGSSRYSGATRSIIRTHVRQERIVTLPTRRGTSCAIRLLRVAGGPLIPTQGGGVGADSWATLRRDRRWTTTTIRLVPRPG